MGINGAEVYYNGIEGYSQIDTYNCYTVEKTSTSMIEPSTGGTAKLETLYLVTSSSGAYARDAVVTGNRKFIPANTYLHIVEMLPGFQSDGYQWAKVRFYDEDLNETVDRFVQMDTYNWHYFYSE